jgi:hypothetical protein
MRGANPQRKPSRAGSNRVSEKTIKKKVHRIRFIDVLWSTALDVLVRIHFMVWEVKCMYALPTNVICSKRKCQGKANGVFIYCVCFIGYNFIWKDTYFY